MIGFGRQGRLVLSWAAVALLATGLGCKRTTSGTDAGPNMRAPALGSISVEDLTPPDVGPATGAIDPKATIAVVRDKLQKAKIFAAPHTDAGQNPVARVTLQIALEDVVAGTKAAARAGMRFRVEIRPSGMVHDRWSEDLQIGAETTYDLSPSLDRKTIFTKLVEKAVVDIVAGYVDRQRIWSGTPAEIQAALEVGIGESRIEAIRVVAERKLTSEVPRLLELLSDQEETVRDAALGALVEMREPRAVAELAKQRSMRDQREMRKIIDAIATLGGPEATDYLGFVADAHDDEEIKAMAKAALERLKRREGKH